MSEARRGAYRASGSWDDLSPPRSRADEPAPPRGLFDALPPATAAADEDYLCVACWEWHADAGCRARAAG
ncbi:MAG: hypothetical protein M9894_36610 [Planctomycetes bacterium]|nr:hypothetical protein [Planctomycetota bacterium]